jgi:hypothetical protein
MARAGEAMKVTVPASATGKGQAEVWLCPVSASVSVAIKRGENSGRTFTYTNVVRRWIKLGDWSGKEAAFSVAMKDIQTGEIDSAVVILQSGVAAAPKVMLGAAQASIR